MLINAHVWMDIIWRILAVIYVIQLVDNVKIELEIV